MEENLAFGGWSGIFIMAVYGLLMLGIGLYTYMKNKNVRESNEEYYLGGKGLGVLVLFFTFYATQYSGNTIIGYAPQGYRIGFEWLQSVTFMILVIVGYLLFAPRLYTLSKKHKFVTPTDWLDKRFKSKGVTILGSILMLYGLGNYLLEQLVAVGQGVSGLTGNAVPYQIVVVFFIFIMLTYSWLGGMRSVAYTDTMQGIALLFGVFILILGSILYFGGLPTSADYMQAFSPEKLGVPDTGGIVGWFSMLALVTVGAAVYPHAIQRIFSAKNEKTLKNSLIGMSWMPFLTTGVVLLIGIIGINAFPDLDRMGSEQLVGMMANVVASQNLFFYWAMVLLFGGIIAAIISTADSVLLTFSSIISKDLYGKFINSKASEHKQIKVGKVTGVIAVFLLLIIAWYPPATLYEIFVLKFELLIQIAPAFILGLYFNKLHTPSVFVGMLAGTIVAATMTFTNFTPFGVISGLWGLAINLIIVVIGSMVFTVQKTQQDEAQKVIGF
ncbi:sodium:solute symporter family protein [Piscibacillus halophilus]|uniref:Sodium/pantothenate symporter n=1 Tax=Piscibacillus halophilus TaxID=571933 RepID=A0A1H9I916_9BACI|nr:sodium:solute symporter family protein [Piscibacillus halophilus]SEQ70895.1 sodium/pantothenate symporter [Piscibacillus halophilus]